ncbi:sodium-coupled monocarboxylate transporter 1-like [Tropilaelaps mercedesae]|uniref:Sodium-coupled monocarboxylate transporter 1-like n=1 Tax=Tropilaelaps mercedesae TaxID=418985 RepID=A0A1V9X215_9ACAR|nr:sodium-coupled monocarboxylate transporter 1-like [Tropilaelaps mercedesae]
MSTAAILVWCRHVADNEIDPHLTPMPPTGEQGGIKAVVYTDTFQTFFMLGALVIVIAASLLRLDGLEIVWNIARSGNRIEFDRTADWLTDGHTLVGLFIGSFFTNLASYATNQMMIVRYMTVNTIDKARWLVRGITDALTNAHARRTPMRRKWNFTREMSLVADVNGQTTSEA